MTEWDELRGAAPPALLRRRPLADAEEVLVLTYTCDLSFFEDVCLREAQAVRARTTVLYDADQLTQGPRRPDYLALPVVCKAGGAFHPKLVVIASEVDAVVAIGSGNATASGWHHNAEVWTLLPGDGPTAPALFHDLADWLRRLPEAVWMEDLGQERLERVADLLTTRPADAEPGQPLLVTTAVRPIVEQLPVPDSPVTSLAVAAPFFDPGAAALGRLVDRFTADQLHLLLTRDVQCDVDSLAEVLKRAPGGTVSTPESSRYHHGKIVEWRTADRAWALTGSANCSKAALIDTMATGGNCELGLLTTVDESLIDAVPDRPVDLSQPDDLHVREPGPHAATSTALRVLGVRVGAERVEATVLAGDGLAPSWLAVADLRLDHERSDGKLHRYTAAVTPDWAVIANGLATAHVVTDAGAQIRDVVVTDVTAALSRIDRPSPLEHTSLPLVVADQAHMAALFEALTHLASVRPDRIAAPPGTSRRRQVEGRIKTAVGPALLRFALGLEAGRPASPDDDVIFDGPRHPELEPSSTGKGHLGSGPDSPPTHPETVATVLDALTERQRKQLRRDVVSLVDASEEWPLPAKLAASRLVLTLTAGGLWPDATEWSAILYWVVVQLRVADREESLDGEHSALATIGLVALRRGIDLRDEPDHQLGTRFEELRIAYQARTTWLSAAPAETVRRYAVGLGGRTLGRLFERTDFVAELRWILGRTALHDAVDRLHGAYLDEGSTIRVTLGRSTRLAVIGALDALRDFPDAHVASEDGPEVHGWWNGRRLLLVTRSGATWRAEVWSNLMTGIATYSRGTPLRPADRRWTASSPENALGT
ncbi:hypothetical protein GA0074696_3333 [Micromonospora purpureochromogenes]|uniref:PLD-like domain-containing protein n=1 Tax=Micromonospora purpureochromogenes TaxID=47872 RepID=A0A1C4YGC9_9ACTN|nr:hypothetical protein [Micromonospora purpureochromogenes]SCF19411.1 hypothetical protein GA0074696_3333 [Micromonospora purpureochromogenes]